MAFLCWGGLFHRVIERVHSVREVTRRRIKKKFHASTSSLHARSSFDEKRKKSLNSFRLTNERASASLKKKKGKTQLS